MSAATAVRLPVAVAWVILLTLPAWGFSRPGSGLAGSPHDLTKFGNRAYHSGRDADMCIYCHVPQNDTASEPQQWNGRLPTSTAFRSGRTGRADPQTPDAIDHAPLWNTDVTGNGAAYRMYENGRGAPGRGAKASQAIANGMTPGATSLLCLGCHDGSVARNHYSNTPGLMNFPDRGDAALSTPYVIGRYNDLENHHPIGFNYDAVKAQDGEIRSADSATLGTAGSVREHLYGAGNTQMECGTCHSVHNTGNTGESLLWRSDVDSRLCLTCHDKGTDPVAMTP